MKDATYRPVFDDEYPRKVVQVRNVVREVVHEVDDTAHNLRSSATVLQRKDTLRKFYSKFAMA
jgi:hypothetical protein